VVQLPAVLDPLLEFIPDVDAVIVPDVVIVSVLVTCVVTGDLLLTAVDIEHVVCDTELIMWLGAEYF